MPLLTMALLTVTLLTVTLPTLQRDLFAAKLAKVKSMDKWTQHSKHFSAEKKAQLARIGSDYDKCIQATKEVFIDLNKDAANRQVYCHATCATDTSNISFVMSAVFDVILKVRCSMVRGCSSKPPQGSSGRSGGSMIIPPG